MGMADQCREETVSPVIWLILAGLVAGLELSQPFLENSPRWEAHAACVAVKVPELLSIPQCPVLYLSYALADYGVGRSITGAYSLVCWEQLMVDHAFGKARVLVAPLYETGEVLFARVYSRVAYYSEEAHYSPHPREELILFGDPVHSSVLLEEGYQRLLITIQAFARLEFVHHLLKFQFSLE